MAEMESDFLKELQEVFLLEAADLLYTCENSFLKLEKDISDTKEMAQILRIFHNLKGSAAAVSFSEISEYCHKIENLLVKIKDHTIPLSADIFELLLKCMDLLKSTVSALQQDLDSSISFRDSILEVERAANAAQVFSPPDNASKGSKTPFTAQEILAFIPEALVLAELSNSSALKKLLDLLLSLQAAATDYDELDSSLIIESTNCFQVVITQADKSHPDTVKNYGLGVAAVTKLLEKVEAAKLEGSAVPTFKVEGMAQSADFDERFLQEFITEARDLLETIDTHLMIIERDLSQIQSVDEVFRGFHTLKSASAILRFSPIESIAHKLESLLEPIRSRQSANGPEIIGICLEGTTLLKKMIDLCAQGKSEQLISYQGKIQELNKRIDKLYKAGSADANAPSQETEIINIQQNRAPNNIQGFEVRSEVKFEKSLSDASEQKNEAQTVAAPTAGRQEGASTAIREAIKVDADRLDRLVDFIGELVIAENMVTQSEDLKNLPSTIPLFRHLDRFNKITRNLQVMGLALRMVPIRQSFKKMVRIVRDLSKKTGKLVDFQMSGEETEIDRTMAEKIGDPLVHMIRNAIDHGLEKSSQDRIMVGKPEMGKMSLKAFHKAGSIWIEIEDDGRGMDRNILIKKAVEKGLISSGQYLSDQEAYQLIFAPGFSTAEKVTDVSGRGVGMDVVRKNIEELRGAIDIETTLGKGTLFRIRIPNTLAIIEGMVIKVGKERYVVPTSSIQKATRITKKDVFESPSNNQDIANHEMLHLSGEILPLFRLSRLYEIAEARQQVETGIVLILEENQKRLAIFVDQIVNQQQFVLKSLGDSIANVPGVSGGTIMSDGQVGLILDVGLLVQDVINKTSSKIVKTTTGELNSRA